MKRKVLRRQSLLACMLLIACTLCSCKSNEKSDTIVDEKTSTEETTSTSASAENIDYINQGDASYVTSDYLQIEKTDSTRLTEDDINTIEEITGIKKANLYGVTNRINYYYRENEDYRFDEYGFLQLDKEAEQCMRSAEDISQEDLSAGTIPKSMNEIALYSLDESLTGEVITVYLYDHEYMGEYTESVEEEFEDEETGEIFTADVICLLGYELSSTFIYNCLSFYNDENLDEHYIADYSGYCVKLELTVTGILKEPTTQIYFSEELCSMLSRAYGGFPYSISQMTAYPGTEESGIQEADSQTELEESIFPATVFLIYGSECDEDTVRVSERLADGFFDMQTGNYCSIYNRLKLKYYLYKGNADAVNCNEDGYSDETETISTISNETHESGRYVIEVDKETFNSLYAEGESYEAAVYLDDDADYDAVILALEEAGYQLREHKYLADIYYQVYTDWTVEDKDGGHISRDEYVERLEK